MIVEQAEREAEGGGDVFSLAGRLAIVGGGVYGINQTMDEYNKTPENVFSKRSSKFKTDLADVLGKASSGEYQRPENFGGTRQSKYFNFEDTGKSDLKVGNIDEIKGLLKGGRKGLSESLGEDLSGLLSRMSNKGLSPVLRYKMSGDEVSYIGIQGGGLDFRINPVLSSGEVITGSGAQNRYVSRPVYQAQGSGKVVYGEDVGLVRALDNNLEKVISGELEVDDFYQKYQTARNFDDKNFPLNAAQAKNPELVNYMKESMIEDPGLNVDPQSRRGLSSRHKQAFMAEQGKTFAGSSSASDINRGILLSKDNPLGMIPFLDETANPKQIFRPVEHVDKFGNSGYRVDKSTLFLDKEEMGYLKDVLKERGMNIGELAEEQILARSDAGKIIDRQRSISISSKGVSDSSEFILDRISKITGLSAGQVSETLRESGISGFTTEQQESIRSIKFGDYGQSLENQLSDIKTQMRDYKALGNAKGYTKEEIERGIEGYRKQLSDVQEKLSRRDFFGLEADMERESKINKNLRDLNLEDVHFQNGKITFRARREKLLGPGDKIHESAGEVKSIIKGNVDEMPLVLAEAYRRKTGAAPSSEVLEKFKSIDFIGNQSSLRPTLDSRNAASLFHNVFKKAYSENNTKLIHELETFKNNYGNIPENERANIFKKVEQMTGMPVTEYANESFGFGKKRTHFVAFGNAAVDMGAGNMGTVSERHFYNFKSLGLDNFIEDVIGRRQDKGSILAAMEFEKTKRLVNDQKFKSPIKASDMTPDMIDQIFPRVTDESDIDPLESRRKFFKKFGVEGTGTIDLGEEIAGTSKLAIFSDESFRGHVGTQVGSTSAVRKYSKVDDATKKLLYEMNKPNKSKEKLERLMKNYQVAMEKMEGSLKGGLLKGKTKDSYFGIVNSAPEGLSSYAKSLGEYYQTKSSLPTVGLATKEKFIEMFGRDEYKAVRQQVKDITGKNMLSAGDVKDYRNLAVSDAWAMITRDPTEGMTHMPMNVLPEDIFDGIKMEGSFSVITEPDKDGYHILKSMFGDVDGDSFQVIAAKTEKSKKELHNLAYGNSERAVAFREAQRVKADISLKGRDKFGEGKRFFDIGIGERREAVARAKQLEKGMIGKISTSLQTVHQANHNFLATSTDSRDFNKFLNLTNSLHYFAENSIKGKYQTFNDLRAQKTLDILNQLTGKEEAALLPVSKRKEKVRGFFDELVLGPDSGDLADNLRKSSNVDTDLAENLRARGVEDVQKVHGWFRNTASTENIDFMFEAYEQGAKMGSDVKDTMVSDILEIASESTESDEFKKKLKYEKLTAAQENTKDFVFKGAKNIGKYALLPAAGIGLAGTLLGGKSEIKGAEQNYQERAKRHYDAGGREMRQDLSPQMKRPKYENLIVEGESSASRMDYNNVPNNSRIRMQDHTRNFDKYEIEEIVERGL